MNNPKAIRALVVDDSVVIRRLMSIVLDKMGLGADYVDNGIKALSMLQDESYDIIFLDIMMEGMDGYKVCKHIKNNEKTKDIPVIMLTSRDGRIDKLRGKMAGADHYLTKPVKMSDFKNTVENFLPITADLKKAAKKEKKEAARPALSSPAKLKSVPVKPLENKTPKTTESNDDAKTSSSTPKSTDKLSTDAGIEKPSHASNSTKKASLEPQLTREEKIARIREMMRK